MDVLKFDYLINSQKRYLMRKKCIANIGAHLATINSENLIRAFRAQHVKLYYFCLAVFDNFWFYKCYKK